MENFILALQKMSGNIINAYAQFDPPRTGLNVIRPLPIIKKGEN